MKFYLLALVFVVGARGQLLLNHGTCTGRCFTKNDYSQACQCDYDCETYGNCCSDFWLKCRGSEYGLVVTSQELNSFAQSIWDNDVNRISSSLYKLNYQGQTTSKDTTDEAANKLIAAVDGQLDAILADTNTTYPTFIHLLNNYATDKTKDENHPAKEIQEEVNFWNAISNTKVIQLAFRFLVDNGYLKGDLHAFHTVLNEMWFELYPHNKHSTTKTDSGFEHNVIGETTHHTDSNGTTRGFVSGFHNWVKFYEEEKADRLDYMGYIKHATDPDMADVRFSWHNAHSRGTTFFVGTSPEFDMALYTVCALVRPKATCVFQINGKHVFVRTTTTTHQHLTQLESAVPGFPSSSSTIVG